MMAGEFIIVKSVVRFSGLSNATFKSSRLANLNKWLSILIFIYANLNLYKPADFISLLARRLICLLLSVIDNFNLSTGIRISVSC